jgi:hypothetical protein
VFGGRGLTGFIHSSHSLLTEALEQDSIGMILSIFKVTVDGFFRVVKLNFFID